jgi:hypothetical protein
LCKSAAQTSDGRDMPMEISRSGSRDPQEVTPIRLNTRRFLPAEVEFMTDLMGGAECGEAA